MDFARVGPPATGDSTPMTDEMWGNVQLTVLGVSKKLFDKQKPEGVEVECDGDGKADVWKIFAKAYPKLDKTSGWHPVMTTNDLAIVHNFIHKELTRVGFNTPSRYVRLSFANYDVDAEHDAPRDAFACMVMGIDAYKKFMNDTERWTATVETKTSPKTPRHFTRSATKAAAKDDGGDDTDDNDSDDSDDGQGDLHNIKVRGARRAIAPAAPPLARPPTDLAPRDDPRRRGLHPQRGRDERRRVCQGRKGRPRA